MDISGLGGAGKIASPTKKEPEAQPVTTQPRNQPERSVTSESIQDQRNETRRAAFQQQVGRTTKNSDSTASQNSTGKPRVSNDLQRAFTEDAVQKSTTRSTSSGRPSSASDSSSTSKRASAPKISHDGAPKKTDSDF